MLAYSMNSKSTKMKEPTYPLGMTLGFTMLIASSSTPLQSTEPAGCMESHLPEPRTSNSKHFLINLLKDELYLEFHCVYAALVSLGAVGT